MAKPQLTHTDFQILKQCVEASTFQGNSVRAVAILLDKLDAHLAATATEE